MTQNSVSWANILGTFLFPTYIQNIHEAAGPAHLNFFLMRICLNLRKCLLSWLDLRDGWVGFLGWVGWWLSGGLASDSDFGHLISDYCSEVPILKPG